MLATLEAIVADPAEFSKCADPRTALYRLFLKVWGTVPVNDHVDQAAFTGDEAGAHRNLDAITLRPRIAFLLSSLEGFDTTEVAAALDSTVEEAASLIDAAGKEIADQIRTDVLIIEDEPFIALDLQSLVEEQGHRVVNVARTHREAVEAVMRERPGLILADIQLADGSSGLEAVNQILEFPFRAGDLHYRLSGAFFDGDAAGARLSHNQAVRHRQPQSGHQSGAIFRSQVASQGRARWRQQFA